MAIVRARTRTKCESYKRATTMRKINTGLRIFVITKMLLQRRAFSHVPVMADQVVELLRPQNGKVFIDMTFGGGGHSRRLLDTNKSIKIIAVDRDPSAYERAQQLAAEVAIKSSRLGIKQSVVPIHASFSQARKKIHLSGIPFETVHGLLFDLGASSMQYDNATRGFSLSAGGPLDMRMDTSSKSSITAEDVVNNLSQESLAHIIKTYGDERRARKVANAIVDARTLLGRIRTTSELAKIVASSVGASIDSLGRFAHPATKTFQALRIFVNNELNELNFGLDNLREFLVRAGSVDEAQLYPNCLCGVALVLTFHSLEDRIVKRHFSGIDVNQPAIKHLSQHDRIRTNVIPREGVLEEEPKKWLPLFKHVEKPTDEEVAANPRSRSAKLRLAARLL